MCACVRGVRGVECSVRVRAVCVVHVGESTRGEARTCSRSQAFLRTSTTFCTSVAGIFVRFAGIAASDHTTASAFIWQIEDDISAVNPNVIGGIPSVRCNSGQVRPPGNWQCRSWLVRPANRPGIAAIFTFSDFSTARFASAAQEAYWRAVKLSFLCQFLSIFWTPSPLPSRVCVVCMWKIGSRVMAQNTFWI